MTLLVLRHGGVCEIEHDFRAQDTKFCFIRSDVFEAETTFAHSCADVDVRAILERRLFAAQAIEPEARHGLSTFHDQAKDFRLVRADVPKGQSTFHKFFLESAQIDVIVDTG